MSTEYYKTKGIVLHTMQHGEAGHIVYIYTEAFGRVTYYVTGGRKGVPTIGATKIMLHPLTVIDFVGYRSRGDMHRFKEAKRAFTAPSLMTDIFKSTITLYISELLYRVVRDSEQNSFLFDYLHYSVNMLERIVDGKANFHLYFTLELTKYLGFYPNTNYQPNYFFDIKSGCFVMIRPQHNEHLEQKESEMLWHVMQLTPLTLHEFKASGNTRSSLLNALIRYISFHHETQYKLRSLEYMSELFF